jgi:hypothetical protein
MEKHLTQRTTLPDLAERWDTDSYTGRSADKWNSLRREVEACLASGGELWEWESDGFRTFAGTYGLAVVRDGAWVREWLIGRS